MHVKLEYKNNNIIYLIIELFFYLHIILICKIAKDNHYYLTVIQHKNIIYYSNNYIYITYKLEEVANIYSIFQAKMLVNQYVINKY